MVFNTYSYYNVIKSMNNTVGGVTLTAEMSKKLRTMTDTPGLPLILLVCWTPGTINRIYQTTLDAGEEGSPLSTRSTSSAQSLACSIRWLRLLCAKATLAGGRKCRGRTLLPEHHRMDSQQGGDELLEGLGYDQERDDNDGEEDENMAKRPR